MRMVTPSPTGRESVSFHQCLRSDSPNSRLGKPVFVLSHPGFDGARPKSPSNPGRLTLASCTPSGYGSRKTRPGDPLAVVHNALRCQCGISSTPFAASPGTRWPERSRSDRQATWHQSRRGGSTGDHRDS